MRGTGGPGDRGHGCRGHTALVVLTVLILAVGSSVAAQWGGWGFRRMPPKFPAPERADRSFTFCRVLYESVRREYLGHGWDTDYPTSDINLMVRLSELTTAAVSEDRHGEPDHVVVRLTDAELYDFPFIFMSDVGTAYFDDREVELLRSYLQRGGFLWVDDFWGERAWNNWLAEIGKVLSPAEYPVQDLPLDHPIFRGLYEIAEVPQIPSIQFWRRNGGAGTSEQGSYSAVPHFRGISDDQGRLMVFMSHNTDIADGWEREGEDEQFFHLFSIDAYAVGINVVLYAMTH